MARSRNPGESVVALLEVLGTRTVEVKATDMRVTAGWTAWKLANVSLVLATAEACMLDLDSNSRSFWFVRLIILHVNSSRENDNHFYMYQVRHFKEIRQIKLLCARRFLVRKLRKCWELKPWSHVARGHSGLQRPTVPGSAGPTETKCFTSKQDFLFC